MCLHFSESALFTPFSSRQPLGRTSHTKVMCFIIFSKKHGYKSPVCAFLIFVSAAHLEIISTSHPGKALKELTGLLMLFVVRYISGTANTNDGLVSRSRSEQMDVKL